MAVVSKKSGIFLLLTVFAQVVFSQARRTEFVYGPRQHLDSGQESPSQSPKRAVLKSEIPVSLLRDLDYEDYGEFDDDDDDSLIYGNEDQFIGNDRAAYKQDPGFYYFNNDVSISEEDEDANDYIYLPLRRVRRRIIPVGKAIDRGRSDSGGSFGRSRSPWAEPPHRNRETIIRRTGPTGSAALFSLYPELAPPEWRNRRGLKATSKKKILRSEEGDTVSSISERSVKQERKTGPQNDQEDVLSEDSSSEKKKALRRKGKMTKHQKEEIAKYADDHGTSEAVEHFSTRLDTPIKAKTVEKFLRRYRNRMERRAGRS